MKFFDNGRIYSNKSGQNKNKKYKLVRQDSKDSSKISALIYVKYLFIMLTVLMSLSNISVADVTGTPGGLWHETNIAGKSGVWYYGDDTTMTFQTGSATAGTLNMTFNLTSAASATLTFDTKYDTEAAAGSSGYDNLTVLAGSDILWQRSSKNSQDNDWEPLSLSLDSYIGSNITITFSFDSKDSVGNDYFGWAIHNAQASVIISESTLVINQLDIGSFPSIDAYVKITDDIGQFLSGLTQSSFSVFEDDINVSQFTIVDLSSNTKQVFSLGLMIDQSGSMGSGMADAVSDIKDFVVLADAQDQFGLVSIGSNSLAAINQVLVLENFTTDKTVLGDAIDTLIAENMAPLYDGIAKTLELTARQSGIKAVIAFTDGDDTDSQDYTEATVIAYALSLNIPVYTIGLGPVDTTILTNIANQTGGTYSAADSASGLGTIYSSIYNQLKVFEIEQYKVNFTSLDPSLTTSADEICVDISASLPTIVSDEACYDKLNMPPTVVPDQTTLAYIEDGVNYGEDLTPGAVVTDQDLDDIINVRLYYRALGSSDIFKELSDLALDATAANTYTGLVPGEDYTAPGIEFYFTASAGSHTRIEPANDYFRIVKKTLWYEDFDEDGYGNALSSVKAAIQPAGYVFDNTDCEDSLSSINPGAPEIVDNEVDENCDSCIEKTYYKDLDGDGYTDGVSAIACTGSQSDGYYLPGLRWVLQPDEPNEADCDDSIALVNPEGVEIVDNEIDEDCDGCTKMTYYKDLDGDRYSDGVSEIACTGSQSDGYYLPGWGWVLQPDEPNETDCDDSVALVNPGGVEIVDNEIDEDCDSCTEMIYYKDLDGDRYSDGVSEIACAGNQSPGYYLSGLGGIALSGDSDDNNPEITITEPPNLIIDSSTTAYLDNGPVSGEDFTLGVVVTDPDGNDITNVSLYYRTLGTDETFTELSGLSLDTDTYTILITVEGYSNPGVEFYFTASDEYKTTTKPDTGYYQIVFTEELFTWYEDLDGDGYGNALSSVTAAIQPAGYVSDNTDDDDSRPDAETQPPGQAGEGGENNGNCFIGSLVTLF